VTRVKTINKAKDHAVEIGPVDDNYKPDPELTTELLHLQGRPFCTSPSQQDWQLGVAARDNTNAWQVHRTVEAYLWQTKDHYIQVKDGYNSDGSDKYRQERIIDPPELKWAIIGVDGSVSQPELPDHMKGDPQYRNSNPFDLGSANFMTGWVKVGPYTLSEGMFKQEMSTEHEVLTPNPDVIKATVASGGELTAADLAKDQQPVGDKSEFSKADENTALLGAPPAFGAERHGPHQAPVSDTTKDYLAMQNLQSDGEFAFIARSGSLEQPSHGDYRMKWTASKLPTESSGQVKVHTILAEQVAEQGMFKLKSWTAPVAEFHLDTCCGYVCCLGYNLIQDEKNNGCGCIAKVDACFFPNASSDAGPDDADLELGNQLADASDNVRKVEKCVEGSVPVADLIQGFQDSNEAKTKFYRTAGFIIMFLGFQFVMDPLHTIFHFIPFVGGAVGALVWVAIFIVALVFSCFFSVTTISLAWLRYRPLWGILGILCAGAIAAGICLIPHS